MKKINYKNEEKLISSFESDFQELKKRRHVFFEFKKGDRTYTGATNVAKKMGVNPSEFRSYFKKIKDKLSAQDYPMGYAIAVAYKVAKKHFKKLLKS